MSLLHKSDNIIFISPDEMWSPTTESLSGSGRMKMVLGQRENGHFMVIMNNTKEDPIDIIVADFPSFVKESWGYQDDYGIKILKLESEEDRFMFKLCGGMS